MRGRGVPAFVRLAWAAGPGLFVVTALGARISPPGSR